MSYPPPGPAVASGPVVRVVRIPVVVLAIVTLLVVGGLVAWGGGDTPSSASPSAGTDSGVGFGASGAGEQGGATAAPTAAPLNPADVHPAAETPIVPTEANALLAWRAPTEWSRQLSAYQSFFPASGYRLGEQRITDGDGGGAWDIVPDQPGYQSAVGLLYIGPDPADPAYSIVQVEVY